MYACVCVYFLVKSKSTTFTRHFARAQAMPLNSFNPFSKCSCATYSNIVKKSNDSKTRTDGQCDSGRSGISLHAFVYLQRERDARAVLERHRRRSSSRHARPRNEDSRYGRASTLTIHPSVHALCSFRNEGTSSRSAS